MSDQDFDILRRLRDGRSALAYDEFRTLIPDWPDWIEVDGVNVPAGPEAGLVYHTRFEGRRFAIVRSRADQADLSVCLYAITDSPLTFSWAPLRNDGVTHGSELDARVRAMRKALPSLLAKCDLSHLGRDGELSEWDRLCAGSRLQWKPYYRWAENWDHDHCVYCGAKFSLDEPGSLTGGFAVQGGPHGDDYEWMCEACVESRRLLLGFVIEPTTKGPNG